jgi:hypothetical protein
MQEVQRPLLTADECGCRAQKGQEKAGVNPGGGDQSQETKAGKLASKEGANLPKASRVEQLGQGLQVVTIPRPGGVGSVVGTGSFFILPASRSVATFQRMRQSNPTFV